MQVNAKTWAWHLSGTSQAHRLPSPSPTPISTQNSRLDSLAGHPGKRLIRPPPPTAAETNAFSNPRASVSYAAVGLGVFAGTGNSGQPAASSRHLLPRGQVYKPGKKQRL